MSERECFEIDAATGQIETLPPTRGRRYRCQLDSLCDVRREMAKVYREARSGLLDVQDASKFTWMLSSIGKVIETSDLEARIAKLEEYRDEH